MPELLAFFRNIYVNNDVNDCKINIHKLIIKIMK